MNRLITLVLASILVFSCGEKTDGKTQSEPDQIPAPTGGPELLDQLVQQYMDFARENDPFFATMTGQPISKMPNFSLIGANTKSAFAKELLLEAKKIDRSRLDYQQQLTEGILVHQLEQMADLPKYFWLRFDVTPYQAGYVFSRLVPQALASAPFKHLGDVENYLDFAKQINEALAQMFLKLRNQQNRGILMPKPTVDGAIEMLNGLRETLPQQLQVNPDRLSEIPQETRDYLQTEITKLLEDKIQKRIENFMIYLSEGYYDQAPDQVGLGQYPQGKEYYKELIRQHTSLNLSPEEIHELGLGYMARIHKEMAAIQKEVGFEGSREAFHQKLKADPQFYAKTPEEVAQRFTHYIAKIEPLIGEYFSVLPKAAYGVKRLDPTAEAGMTFGYYQVPTPDTGKGLYRFNGSELESRTMIWSGPLIYHELIPGHHFHLARQLENDSLSEFRKTASYNNAYTEGWANYAAGLAVEMKLLEDPYERYGWLLFDSFITARLVVDTGLNYFDWPLQKARDYMLANTFQNEFEVNLETLRYGADMPGQALGYKLGMEKIREIRRNTEQKLAGNFDIKAFHEAVLGSGTLSLDILEDHVNHVLQNPPTQEP